ncbi:UNVERIFIED_CONTAM: hypothetical protein GTU68_012790, partial [Idotea baltica]|nr:hypothetical protein [Idotea baltica]
ILKEDFYKILGVEKNATAAEIKKAYRKKAIKYHPDKNPDDKTAEENFKKAAEAYEILGNAEKKARYDQYGHSAFEGGGQGGFGGGGMNMEDIFSQFGDIFGGAFGGGGGFSGFGGGGREKEESVSIKIPPGVVDGVQLKVSSKGNEAPGNSISGDLLVVIQEIPHDKLKREGNNLHYDMYVSIPEAILGESKEIDTLTGKVRIKIESGTQSGKILRLRGKGLPSLEGYGKGDLLIHVNVWTPKNLSKDQKSFFEKMKGDENFVPIPTNSDKSFFEKVKDMFS